MRYVVETLDELDNFNDSEALAENPEGDFTVYVISTGETFSPCWCIRGNGDIDGLEGWNPSDE